MGLLNGCAAPTLSFPVSDAEPPAAVVYLVNHGWHTGLVFWRFDLPTGLWPEADDFPGAAFLEVGWGDWDFYQTPGLSPGITLKALLWPTASVLHVVGFRQAVASYFPESEIVSLQLSRPALSRLVRFVHDSYAREGSTKTPALGRGLYGESRFYPARGRFHLFNTCNVWTARALQVAGYPIDPSAAITASMLLSQIRPYGKSVPAVTVGF